ncbi:MAG: N-formylglutamate amidohydrolase [Rhizobiales bacterium]|nr:N-formylglutamate amidohydrolase [Hyphomicrobiales bacterium]
MGEAQAANDGAVSVRVRNRTGKSSFVVLCDHASSYIPPEYGTLGLSADERISHIGWDPGALPVAERLAAALDAILVESCVSRLIADCNRPLDAPDLVPEISERTIIPGNRSLAPEERERRIAAAHAPYHARVDEVIGERLAAGRETWLLAIHSFTPVYRGVSRPWQIGVIHDEDTGLAGPILEALSAAGGITVGDNQPYSPADRVYYTLERHARSRGLPCAMIEIRNDEIRDEHGQREWADLLTGILMKTKPQDSASSLAGSGRSVGEKAGRGK